MLRTLLIGLIILVAACTSGAGTTSAPTAAQTPASTAAPATDAPATDAPATTEPTAEVTAEPTAEATAEPTPETTEEPSAEVTVAIGPDGYLVDTAGLTLYTFDNDEDGVSNCELECLATWPPLTVAVAQELTTGEGLDPADFATIDRSSGDFQVTFQGMPLYFYVDDLAPGDTNGDGLGDVWHIVPADTPSSSTAPAGGGIDY